MNRPKSWKPGGREEPIEDPQLLKEALASLYESEVEFPIKVEGTSTLPYASSIQALLPETCEIILKLVRPLPHEMMSGAVFRAVLAVDDQRYEALLTYKQREAYLQYRFTQPERLFYADRRQQKRYPFRPRENAYVSATDGGIPGLGVAGPLANIGMGGFCMRVDRVLRMDDGLRIPPSTALFERGGGFPRVRIQDLPRLPLLEVSGWVAHAAERGTEVLLGFNFGNLPEDQARSLRDSLAFREKMFVSKPGGGIPDSGGAARKEAAARQAGPAPAAEDSQPLAEDVEAVPVSTGPLRLLQRKTARLMLVGQDDTSLARYQLGLWQKGFHRVETVRSCEEARAFWQAGGQAPKLALLALSAVQEGDQEPLAAVRRLEKDMVALAEIPAVIVCDDLDPTLLLGQSQGIRFLPWSGEGASWDQLLDGILGFQDE